MDMPYYLLTFVARTAMVRPSLSISTISAPMTAQPIYSLDDGGLARLPLRRHPQSSKGTGLIDLISRFTLGLESLYGPL